jgi:hypothetical protein
MPSLAQRHQQKLRAQEAARAAGRASKPAVPAAPPEDSAAGAEYAQLRTVLHENLRTLKDIASHEAREPKKAEFARQYETWIEGVLQADEPVQDEILLTNMIWACDYGDYAYALRLGEFALKHGLTMPEPYNRTIACFLAEDIAEDALADADRVDHEVLLLVDRMTAEADMPDPARAKLMKALGRSWLAKAEAFDPAADQAPAGGQAAYAAEAVTAFERALKLDKKAGVKKNIEAAKRLAAVPDGTGTE